MQFFFIVGIFIPSVAYVLVGVECRTHRITLDAAHRVGAEGKGGDACHEAGPEIHF